MNLSLGKYESQDNYGITNDYFNDQELCLTIGGDRHYVEEIVTM